MTNRPYPDVDRARRQLEGHEDETSPLTARRPLSPMERALVEYATAAVRSAAPALASLTAAMRVAGSKEKPA